MEAIKKTTKKSVGMKKKTKDLIFIISMLAIPVIHWLIFYLYLNFNSILLAFQLPHIDGSVEWTFDNFVNMFREFSYAENTLPSALGNTFIFFFSGLLITFPLSFLLCYFLYKKILCYRVFRVIFYLPNIIAGSVIAVLFRYLIAVNGPFAQIWPQLFGTQIPDFFHQSSTAMPALVFYNIFFGLGGNLVLFSGAMSHIDNSIIEAGKIDGVNMFQEMIHLVVPLMWPTMSTVLTFQIIGIFNSSGPILLFTKGEYNTFTLSYWIYDKVAFGASYNYPSAVGLVMTLIGAPFALFMRWLLSKGVDDVTM